MTTFFQQTAQAMIAKHIDRDLCKIPFPRQPKTCVWVSAVGGKEFCKGLRSSENLKEAAVC
ncbi:TPA: hypothetical protein ACU8BG_002125 [Neisseria subflava]